MNPERRKQIEELRRAALCGTAERAQVLGRADPDLRREVEALLAQESAATEIMPKAGDQLGPYKIEAAIGVGGMGEVFRATDTRLRRTVAIKILPRDKVADPERKRRFLQEARAASALNHPNIVTLYDMASDNGTDYLVMEHVAGTPLDKIIALKGLPLPETLGYVTQMASALAAAHAAGIVHRDIKPANVIVTAEGQVKILDFGLAKLTEAAEDSDTLTEAGTVMGTVAYMSPEQASAKPLDHRTDIFSLGVVMYEMIAGRRPFSRKTRAETMSAIINDPHPPLTEAPARMADILDKALEKDPKERYQSAGDLAVDLRRVQRTAPAPPATLRARPGNPFLWIAAAVLVLAGAATLWLLIGRSAPAENPLAEATFTLLTNFPGDEVNAAISPDGKFVAFLSDRGGSMDVWLTQVGTGRFQRLTQDGSVAPSNSNRALAFTGDGSEIVTGGPPPPNQRVRRMPLMGGALRPFLAENVVTVNWSPDGARLAYFANPPGDPIFVADRDGSNPRQIFRDRPGVHNHFVTWSTDGRWIYFVHGNVATSEMDLWRIPAAGGQPERLTQVNRYVGYPTPLDTRTVLFVAVDQDGSGPWLWALNVESRSVRRVSSGLERYTSVAASTGGRRLVASRANPVAGLWSLPILDHPAEEAEVKAYSLPNARALAPRFAGKALFYLSSQSGGDGLWRFENGQSSEIWNAADGVLREPAAVSRDGGQAVVVLRRDGRYGLRLVATDGSQTRPLAAGLDVRGSAAWSPDGKWIVVGGNDGKGDGLFKVPVDGGPPVRLAAGTARNPVWSPDGALIAYAGANISGAEPLRVVGAAEGSPFDLPAIPLPPLGERIRFLPDGSGLVYMQGSLTWQEFWMLDLATKKTRPLTHLAHTATMRTFDITSDGKQIVFDRMHENSDIVLIDLQKTGR